MCGFITSFSNFKRNKKSSFVNKDVLNHRGPDRYSSIVKNNHHFFFWRLSIVDRDHGDQPMEDLERGVTVVLNGEIYNYIEIKRKLERSGHVFKSKSDTEVVLRAYIEYSLECFDLFEGMFSICILDEKKDRIVVSTDLFGIKPLYYSKKNGELVFSSEQSGIFKVLNSRPYLNKSSIYDYMLYQHVTNTDTLFKDIEKIPPGLVVQFSLEKLTKISSRPIKIKTLGEIDSYSDYKKKFREVIVDQVVSSLSTDLDVTFQLSGGLDSNLLLGLAAKYIPEKLKYTVSSYIEGDFDNNEVDYIKRVTGDYGIENTIIPINAKRFFSELNNSIKYLGEPTGDAGVVAQFIVNKEISKTTKIAIAGQGADEMFFGYIRNYLAYLHHNEVLTEKYISKDPLLNGWSEYANSFIGNKGVASEELYFNKISRFNFNRGIVSNDSKFERLIKALEIKKNNDFQRLKNRSNSLNAFMLNSELSYQLPPLLQMEDRASMSVSVETRVPLCTNSILSLAHSGKSEWKLYGGQTKGIIRDTFKDVIPEYIINRRQKVGRPIPLKKWIYSKHGEESLYKINSSSEMIGDVFGFDFVDYALRNPNPYDRSLWMVLSFSLWVEEFNVSF